MLVKGILVLNERLSVLLAFWAGNTLLESDNIISETWLYEGVNEFFSTAVWHVHSTHFRAWCLLTQSCLFTLDISGHWFSSGLLGIFRVTLTNMLTHTTCHSLGITLITPACNGVTWDPFRRKTYVEVVARGHSGTHCKQQYDISI